MYFITIKRMLEVCFSAHPNIQYRASIIKGKELRKMALLSPFMVFTRLCLPRYHPVNHRLLFLTRFHQVNPGCFDAVVS